MQLVKFHNCNAHIAVESNGMEHFVSYQTTIAEHAIVSDSNGMPYDAFWIHSNALNYSPTTTRQLTRWLNEVCGFAYHTISAANVREMLASDPYSIHTFCERYASSERRVSVIYMGTEANAHNAYTEALAHGLEL